jgi:hypothetical protein
MAWRTTHEEVVQLLGVNYNAVAKTDLSVFIETANLLTTEVVTCATSRGKTLSSELLKKIEGWLAAHFYGCSDQFYSSKKTGDAQGTFQGQTEMHLKSTQYGQNAITLDISGCLASFSKGTRAGVVWLGKPPSEQIDYKDRD